MKLNPGGLPIYLETFYVETGPLYKRGDICNWLADYNDNKGRAWTGGHGVFFENSEDAVMFKLRWG